MRPSTAALAAKAIQRLPAQVTRIGTAVELLSEDRTRRDASDPRKGSSPEALGAKIADVGALELAAPAQKALWANLWPSAMSRPPSSPTVRATLSPTPELRDNENVPLPLVPVTFVEEDPDRALRDAWSIGLSDRPLHARRGPCPTSRMHGSTTTSTKIGYEIPAHDVTSTKTCHLRTLEEIDAEMKRA